MAQWWDRISRFASLVETERERLDRQEDWGDHNNNNNTHSLTHAHAHWSKCLQFLHRAERVFCLCNELCSSTLCSSDTCTEGRDSQSQRDIELGKYIIKSNRISKQDMMKWNDENIDGKGDESRIGVSFIYLESHAAELRQNIIAANREWDFPAADEMGKQWFYKAWEEKRREVFLSLGFSW